MKKIFLCALFVAASLFSVFFFSCNSSKDVVTDIKPVETNEWRSQLVRDLQNARTDDERRVIMAQDDNEKHLTAMLIDFLRRKNYKCEIKSVTYHFGNGKANAVEDGNGERHDGVYTNQPYASIQGDTCFKDGLNVFIECFNGTFSLIPNNNSAIGNGTLVFTIRAGEGTNHHITDYLSSISIAHRFGLKFYQGEGWDNEISYDSAVALAPRIMETRVSPRVFDGDVFDLGRDTYNGKPPVNPNTRL
jgi:hypothetical protein